MASRRLTAALLALAALAPLLAGCGDDDGSATAGDLTKVQYMRRATAICMEHRARIADELAPLSARLSQGDPIDKVEASKAMKTVILPGVRSEYEELRRLPYPAGDEYFLNLMLSKFSRSLDNGEEKLSRLFHIKPSAYSEFAEGTLMTSEYGIKGCGSLRRSPQAVVRAYAVS